MLLMFVMVWFRVVNSRPVPNVAVVDKLYIYPIKSCGAVSVSSANFSISGGMHGDRQWALYTITEGKTKLLT
jgi:hypothetical protein